MATPKQLLTHAYVAAWPIHKSALKAAAAEDTGDGTSSTCGKVEEAEVRLG